MHIARAKRVAKVSYVRMVPDGFIIIIAKLKASFPLTYTFYSCFIEFYLHAAFDSRLNRMIWNMLILVVRCEGNF